MKQAKTLTNKEYRRVVTVTKSGRHSVRNCIALSLSFNAGLRVKEIASLKIEDVFTNNNEVKPFVVLDAEQTKGSNSRTIVLNQKLQSELQQYIKSLSHISKDHPLIRSQKGNAFSANALCQIFGRLYKDAAVDGASSHSGRRTFITNLAHKGVSAKVLMTLAGHQHLSTTQRYIDVNDNMLQEAVELV